MTGPKSTDSAGECRVAAGAATGPVSIRPATDGDWPSIWPFFAEIVSAGETYAFPTDLTVETGAAWWMEPPPVETVVAVDGIGADEVVLGSAKWGPNRPGRGAHISTASFMVDPSRQGRGVGRRLAEYVVAAARAAGYDGMQFNAVVETNVAAVALWQSLGFQVIGTVPGAFDSRAHGKVGLHVMYLPFR
jgi:ribosomal protein S18 acetylase RimI-like enzyme